MHGNISRDCIVREQNLIDVQMARTNGTTISGISTTQKQHKRRID
jgi:hypothetical protein